MILPTKRLPEERALIRVGSDILAVLEEPKSISRLWTLVRRRRAGKGIVEVMTFDWFVLALDMLYALNAVYAEDGLIRRSDT